MPQLIATTIRENFLYQAQRLSQKTAIILQRSGQADFNISYQTLLNNATHYAHIYAKQGIAPGEIIILILQHSEELIYGFWGAILGGQIPAIMPFLTEKLSPQRYRTDLAAMLQITRPAAILTYPEFYKEICNVLEPNGSVRQILITNQISPTSITQGKIPNHQNTESIAVLQHSSGTTGLQKGVALSHRAIINQLNAYSKSIALHSEDVIVSWLPLYHDMGLIASFLMPILTGLTLVLMSPFDWVRAPYRLLQAVTNYHGTISWLPNFAYNFCAYKIRERDLKQIDLSSWRLVINCSESVKFESHTLFYQRFAPYHLQFNALQCCYAMAENVFAVTQTNPSSPPALDEIDRESYLTGQKVTKPRHQYPTIQMMSSGRVLPNVHLRIVDENKNDLPDRTIGEIAIQSDCMLTGYYNRPDATHAAIQQSWYFTGDYGYTVQGEVFVVGRKKDILVIGGKNIYPQDIEALAYDINGIHPGRAVAFSIEDPQSGTEAAVIVAEVNTQDPNERQRIADELRQYITQNSDITLRHVYLVDEKWIIKTSSGKTARIANREKFLQETRV